MRENFGVSGILCGVGAGCLLVSLVFILVSAAAVCDGEQDRSDAANGPCNGCRWHGNRVGGGRETA
jgi:hypothetical protein